ncbi:MAG TPA: metal-dependent hydrolase [Noviherbaspirillum sp.]|nr:metal-dependent hydrolase [Noviherbaspirillum sp.]
MDNLSHTLSGLVAGELLHRALPAEPSEDRQRRRHRLMLVSCALASSFPDLDIVLTPLLPEPLGYLLHHRGHTHTVLYAFPQALLLCALLWLLWPSARALLRESRAARLGLAAGMAVSFGLHLLMDYLNSYGVHPFHPIDSRWLYGDMVFILEPVFWITLGVPLVVLLRRAWLRATLLGLLAALLAYFSAAGFLHWASLIALYAGGLLLIVLQQPVAAAERAGRLRTPGGARGILAGIALLAAFLAVQAVGARAAARQIGAVLAQKDPDSTLKDSARTAFPSNPLCWNFVSVESDEQAGHYRLRRGVLSIAPGLLPVSSCPAVLAERHLQREIDPGFALLAEHTASLAELRRLQREDCFFEAWMRFARAPQVEGRVASDKRFSGFGRGNFTTMDLDDFAGRDCPRHVPRWDFPRADLLE